MRDMLMLESCVLQAGTLSGNPLAMTAGLKTLEILDRPGQYEYLEKVTKRLIEGILAAGRDAGHSVEGGSISGRPHFYHVRMGGATAAHTPSLLCADGMHGLLLPFLWFNAASRIWRGRGGRAL